jgi:hypothetical protein
MANHRTVSLADIDHQELLAFFHRTKEALESGDSLLDLSTPFGKRFGDCTGEETRQLSEAFKAFAAAMPDGSGNA